MNYYPGFGRMVDDALIRKDRSRSWLAQRLGVNPSTVSRWLNDGQRPRDAHTVVRIADILGLSSERQALLVAAGYGYQKEVADFTAIPDSPRRHNLPSPVTSLVGRAPELADIADRLSAPDCRLLTLWGLGGIGKTRLGLAAAHAEVDSPRFPDGVYYVPLVPLSRPQQIVPAIAAAMNFPLDTVGGDLRRTPDQQLCDFLRQKRLLLLLDNLEHLPEVGPLITGFLQKAEGVKVLATSRERLRLPGEQVYPLTGLNYPAEDIDEDIGNYDASAFGAAQLFLARARLGQPGFTPIESEIGDLIRICQVVDGMPLALELAAAWTDTLTLGEIRRELETSLGFLATNAEGVVERHRSMEVVFDASWQRLTDNEQQVFEWLSVFRGGFTREVAEQVADASPQVMSTLVGKSFIRFHREEGRYDIHELMRQYGTERLAEDEETKNQACQRHAVHFCTLLQGSYEELKGRRQLEALTVLTAERGNLQVAWEYLTGRHDLGRIAQAMDGLGRFYEWTGNLTGGVTAFAAVAEDSGYEDGTDGARLQARALAWLANFELLSGNPSRAEQHLVASLKLVDELTTEAQDVRPEKALALLYLGNLEQPRDMGKAVDAYEKSSALYVDAGLRWESLIVKSWLGKAHQILHDEQAGPLLTEARAGLEEVGDDRSLGRVLEDLAIYYMLNTAELEKSLDTIRMSLELRRRNGDLIGISASLNTLAGAHAWLGEPEPAVVALDEALVIAQRLGHRVGECKILLDTVMASMYIGPLDRVEAMAERSLALSRELGQARYIQYGLLQLGALSLARGDSATAHRLIVEAFDVMADARIPVVEPWPHAARAYSAWKVGKWDEVQYHIGFSLRQIVERTDVWNAVGALRFLAQVLGGRGDLERAAEIGATAAAVSRWDRSLTAQKVYIEPLEELVVRLPPEVAEAAQARGHSRDVFETAAKLLDEVQRPDWHWV